ncbi:hypothetical protein GCM10008908_12350 [Clostridium subterminale]|uniref:Uncharacterized protein n=1 Tax=Clostridium subterminale TaxID=1550 RepID=A0ABP3VUS9_CLOSU
MFHNIYSNTKMYNLKAYAHKGAILARETLTSLQITNKDETKLYIYNLTIKSNIIHIQLI